MLFSWGVLLIPTCERGVCNSTNPILSPEGMLSFPLESDIAQEIYRIFKK